MVSGNSNKNKLPSMEDFDLDEWIKGLGKKFTDEQTALIRKAGELAIEAHKNQKRASGEPYARHVFAVANILLSLEMDYESIVAAILHDTVEDTEIKLEEIEKGFGHTVMQLVDGVTKMDIISDIQSDTRQGQKKDWGNAESLRKMLLAMVEDVRVVLIKLADRLHNMRTLSHLPEEKRKRIASETMEIFAPLANRMGIWQIKWELEDLSLRYLEPDSYKKIAVWLDEKRIDRETYIQNVISILNSELGKVNIKAEITGRPKHIYSIWRKMDRKGVDFNEIFDVRAVRVLVNSITDCYAVLGIVHTLWRHIHKEFDDYIATPKGNNYQSIHTAVIGPEGKTLEIQIRTRDMHEHAELGVASHWRYKEGSSYDPGFEQKIAWLRQILEWKDEEMDAGGFVDRFKGEVIEDRVYIVTPKGNVMDLPKGATPLDFAYHIHTDIGHRCRGAKVNGSIVPITYSLNTGEQVEILTSKTGTPSRDWLNPHLGYLKTSRARAKVRTWFKQQDQEKNVAAGRVILDKELHRLNISDLSRDKIASHFHHTDNDDLFAAIGRGEITSGQIASAVNEITLPSTHDVRVLRETRLKRPKEFPGDVNIQGVGNLLTQFARCCKPAPGDPIVGFITKGRGVTIHRADCQNVLRQPKERLLEVSWSERIDSTYPADIAIVAYDRQGLLRDVTSILSNEKVNVLAVNTLTDIKDHLARMKLTVEVSSISQLSKVLSKIDQIPNVIETKRSQQ